MAVISTETEMEVVVLVKAAPVLTRDLEETMCVAGARLGEDAPQWIRLHPVPFRDLDEEQRFAKYQRVAPVRSSPQGRSASRILVAGAQHTDAARDHDNQ